MWGVTNYLDNVNKVLQKKNLFQRGEELADLLSIQHSHVMSCSPMPSCIDKSFLSSVDPQWQSMVSNHLKCISSLSVGNFVAACDSQIHLVELFIKFIQSTKDQNWMLPVMYACTRDLRLLAIKVSNENAKRGSMYSSEDKLEKAIELLMVLFRVCVGDKRSNVEFTKRLGTLFIINQLFKLYFKIGKDHLMAPLIRAIELSPLKDSFSLAQRVTYRYFIGRKALFDGEYELAERHLTFAFNHCHRRCRNNKRLILIYLIPVKMFSGTVPNAAILYKYGLTQFSGLVHGFVNGNLHVLDRALRENEGFFIKHGILLILEKLKTIAYRNLFKKVQLLHNNHIVPIVAFVDAVNVMQQVDMSPDEIECILANLIFEGKIKGYISTQHQKVVFSKLNAFPSLLTYK